MNKFKQLARIKELYANGENIIKFLRSLDKQESNSIEDILISYDFQAGSYIKGFADNPEFKEIYCTSLATAINDLGTFNSIIEVGVGEATTLKNLISKLSKLPTDILGFDISWSRLKFAKEFLSDFNLKSVSLFTANLFEIPLLDSSIDVVYTSHSIEPNGGREEEALRELYRIARQYLVLLEPSYEFADEKSRARMKEHGYVINLHATAKRLGYKIIEHRLFDHSSNPLNPTSIMIIEKKSSILNESSLKCPISLTDLVSYDESLLFSKDSLLAYPVISDIPCLLKENSMLATHLMTDYQEYKRTHSIEYK